MISIEMMQPSDRQKLATICHNDGFVNIAKALASFEDLTEDQKRIALGAGYAWDASNKQRYTDESRAEAEGIAMKRHRRLTRRARYAL